MRRRPAAATQNVESTQHVTHARPTAILDNDIVRCYAGSNLLSERSHFVSCPMLPRHMAWLRLPFCRRIAIQGPVVASLAGVAGTSCAEHAEQEWLAFGHRIGICFLLREAMYTCWPPAGGPYALNSTGHCPAIRKE